MSEITSHIEMDETTLNNAKVKVFGVGGAGGNTVNRMVGMNIEGVEYYAVNTDAKALERSLVSSLPAWVVVRVRALLPWSVRLPAKWASSRLPS